MRLTWDCGSFVRSCSVTVRHAEKKKGKKDFFSFFFFLGSNPFYSGSERRELDIYLLPRYRSNVLYPPGNPQKKEKVNT